MVVESVNDIRIFFKNMVAQMRFNGKDIAYISSLEQAIDKRTSYNDFVIIFHATEVNYSEIEYMSIYADCNVTLLIATKCEIGKFEKQEEAKQNGFTILDQILGYLRFCKQNTVLPFNALNLNNANAEELTGASIGVIEYCFGARLSLVIKFLPNYNQNLNYWKSKWVQPSQ